MDYSNRHQSGDISAAQDNPPRTFAKIYGEKDEVEYDRCQSIPIDPDWMIGSWQYLGRGVITRFNESTISNAHPLYGKELFFYRNDPTK